MIASQVSKMVDIFHHHVNDHIVASTHQEYSPDLGDGLYPTQQSIDHRSLILGKLDEGQCLQVQPNGPQIKRRESLPMRFLALTMPTPGRQMKGYTMLADPIRRDHKELTPWL